MTIKEMEAIIASVVEINKKVAEGNQRIEDNLEKSNIAHEEQRAKDRAAYEEQQAKYQAAYEQRQAAYEKQRAKDRAAHEEQRAKDRAAHEEQRAKDRAERKQSHAEIEESIKKNNKTVAKIGSYVKNDVRVVEDYFVQALKEKGLKVGDIDFDTMYINPEIIHNGKPTMEIDIVLTNGSYIAMLETKKLLHINDIKNIREERIAKFRDHFPGNTAKKMLVIVASFAANDDALSWSAWRATTALLL